jgi:hypothetical protein
MTTVLKCRGSLVRRLAEPILRSTAHIIVGSKAKWFEITDELPQYEEYKVVAGAAG